MSSTGRRSMDTGQSSDPFRARLQNKDGFSVGKPESASKGTDGHPLTGRVLLGHQEESEGT